MEKKSLNKKLQLNKETIAELNKRDQSQILGGETATVTCNTCALTKCNLLCNKTFEFRTCGPEESVDNCLEPVTIKDDCVYSDAC